ncbi:hypothetical protein [Cognatilysobacter bugurensis]|uniref:CAP-Gly protein n=1 Tax=Cognatilysobacter bugurensis TaxID=543356 RepID=A0A918SUA5_9GAMM|nr:hypothetical protein [Lysobacter bugurensis]GHA72286.1 hypothetical protein GCM10007067_05960 [Lysobacter bugurensis]
MAAVTHTTTATAATRRVSWGAILAGAVVGLAVMLLMGVLGIAIGASVIDPMQEQNPVEGIGIGSGIYFVISVIVSMLAGGYVAGALATLQTHHDRTLHGLATWAIITLLSMALLATGIGRLIGGTLNLLGEGLQKAGQAASAVTGPIVNQAQDELKQGSVDISALRREAEALLRDTGNRQLKPGELERDAEQVGDAAGEALQRAAQNPAQADEALNQILDRIQSEARETINGTDREALVNLIVARTGMSRDEAQKTVDNWDRSYSQAYQQAQSTWQQAKVQAEQKARQWGQVSAEAVAAAAWWSLFVLVLGAVAAAMGANIGANRLAVATRTDVRR